MDDLPPELLLHVVRASADEESLAEEETYTRFHPSFTYPVWNASVGTRILTRVFPR